MPAKKKDIGSSSIKRAVILAQCIGQAVIIEIAIDPIEIALDIFAAWQEQDSFFGIGTAAIQIKGLEVQAGIGKFMGDAGRLDINVFLGIAIADAYLSHPTIAGVGHVDIPFQINGQDTLIVHLGHGGWAIFLSHLNSIYKN